MYRHTGRGIDTGLSNDCIYIRDKANVFVCDSGPQDNEHCSQYPNTVTKQKNPSCNVTPQNTFHECPVTAEWLASFHVLVFLASIHFVYFFVCTLLEQASQDAVSSLLLKDYLNVASSKIGLSICAVHQQTLKYSLLLISRANLPMAWAY